MVLARATALALLAVSLATRPSCTPQAMQFETIALVGQPISLADLRLHLRIDVPDDRDGAIAAMLSAAVQLAQGYTGTALCAQRLRVFAPLTIGQQRVLLPFRGASVAAAQLLVDGVWLIQDPAAISALPLGSSTAISLGALPDFGAASASALELEVETPTQALDDATRSALLLLVANLERNAGDEEGFDPLTPAVRQLLQARKLDWSAA